ncbi:Vitamin B12 import ATP-binding protein BtuD [subsurface metagenome]
MFFKRLLIITYESYSEMLYIENISKKYTTENKTIQVLDNISLTVKKGEFLAIHGPSGCGKTTLLLTAGGLLHPDEGRILIDSENIYYLSAEKRAVFRAKNIGFVFQQYHLISYLTVLENVQVPALAQKNNVPENKIYELIFFALTAPREISRLNFLFGQISNKDIHRRW